MAGYSFLSKMLPTAISAANALNTTRRQNDMYQQAQSTYTAQQQELNAALTRQEQENAIKSEQDATQRRDALRRAMARQKAQFGAQGIDSSDGSAEAILLGLSQQSETEQAQQNALDQLRDQALRDNAAQQSRKNLLALNNAYRNVRLSSLYSD